MGAFSKNSLALLKERIDLIEVLSPYIKLQRSGAAYKALCPFHDEKSPSLIIQRGDTHYHCFGCGAHGDAIQFLMAHLKMSFVEAVEHLAERFHVTLEEASSDEKGPKGPGKTEMKDALEKACQFYQFYLLHTLEGHAALDYLYNRGITLDFIKTFQFGFSPAQSGLFLKTMQEQKVSQEVLEATGLMSKGREFFSSRIMIPIRDASGSVIGFSGRKYKVETSGGKYINSPETTLFKKSKVLFGLSYCRKTIAKTKKALIVEGQLDALRLIHAGFDWTVAGQGTAFGEEHVKELLHLGIRTAVLALDGDTAGREAAVKIGDLFQKEGVEVLVVRMPDRSDPDTFLQEKGPDEWEKLVNSAVDYLTFYMEHLSKTIDIHSPAGKNELVQTMAGKIRKWDHPLMVHESLRKLARITQTPESIIGPPEQNAPQVYIKRSASVTFSEIDPDRILEADLLRWLFLMGESVSCLIPLAEANLTAEHFRVPAGRKLFEQYLTASLEGKPRDLLSLAIDSDDAEQQLFLAEILQKRVNREKAEALFIETLQKMLERHWMYLREEIRLKIFSGLHSEAEVLELARKFDSLKSKRPTVLIPEGVTCTNT